MKNSMGLRSWFGALVAAALVVGCSGGSGSSSSNIEIKTSTPLSPPGVYQTRVTIENDDGSTSTINGLSLLSPTGEYVTELSPPDSSFLDAAFGQLVFLINLNLVDGEAINYFQKFPPGSGWDSSSGDVEGTVGSGVINLTAGSSKIRMTRSATESDQGFDLSALADVYGVTDLGGYSISLTLQTDGSLDGTDSNGCAFSGDPSDPNNKGIEVPDPDYNVFKISFKVFDCSGAETTIPPGDYKGLGSFDQDANELYFYSNNGEVGLLIRLVKGG